MEDNNIQIIGIDLGTTNSVMASIDMNGPRIIRNAEGDAVTPSVVGSFKEKVYIGRHAYNRWEDAASNTIVSVKRLMGRAFVDPQVKKIIDTKRYDYKIVKPSKGTKQSVAVVMNGEEYYPEEISAKILKKMKDNATNKLGKDATHAVITTPAYFSDKQRYATKQAGIQAGLTVLGLIDEPTAVALAYGMDKDFEEAKAVLVYDLGGGTFDVSVLMMTSGTYTLLAKEGDMWLGGDDFDKVIIDYVNEQIEKEYGSLVPFNDKKYKVRLKKAAREAKEALSSCTETNVYVGSAFVDEDGDSVEIDVEITRDQFELLSKELVARTVAIIGKALEAAMLDKDEDINHVILAGNSSRMPMIQKAVETIFGTEKVKKDLPFKESVALGAAIYAARLQGIVCLKCNTVNMMDAKTCRKCGDQLKGIVVGTKTGSPSTPNGNGNDPEVTTGDIDITPMSYGIQSSGDQYNVFINKGDPVPTPIEDRNTQTFTTQHPRFIVIPVYGGEDKEAASNNESQCEAFAILPRGCTIGTKVNIRLWLNRNNSFEVEAWLQNDGTRLKPVLFRGHGMEMVFEELLEMEKVWEETKGKVYSQDETKGLEMEEKKEDIYTNIKDKKEEDALNSIRKFKDELRKPIENPQQPPHFFSYVVEGMVSKYEWSIPSKDIEETRTKIDQNRSDDLSDKEFKKWFTNQFLMKNPHIMILADMEMLIMNLEKEDSQKAMEFRNRFNAIIERLKKGNMAAFQELQTLDKNIKDYFDQLKPKGVVCKKCGKVNRASARNCRYCQFDMWLVENR